MTEEELSYNMEINNWIVEYDPQSIAENGVNENATYDQEDIFQAHNKLSDIIIDMGYYQDIYKLYKIKDKDWENPIETFECERVDATIAKIFEWMAQ